MFVRMVFGLLVIGVIAHASVTAPVHCQLHRSAQAWEGVCPGLLGGKPTLRLSTATSLKSGRYRKSADPVAIYSGDMRGPGGTVFIELEVYTGGSGILRPEGLNWLAVANVVGPSDRLEFDVEAAKTVPPSDLDREIISRAASILISEAAWDRADDRQCAPEDKTWSIYCAMIRATLEVTGGIHHRRPAMELVRAVVDRRSAGRNYEHRLRDYNNDPKTTLADVRSLFEEALITARKVEVEMLQDSPMFSYIPAKDVARARRFYEQTLGFRVKEETAGGVVYEFAGGTACFLYPTPNAGSSRASQAFWAVKDIESEVAELTRRGVTLEKYDLPGTDANGITTGGGAKAAWFKDSEGNIMAIVQAIR